MVKGWYSKKGLFSEFPRFCENTEESPISLFFCRNHGYNSPYHGHFIIVTMVTIPAPWSFYYRNYGYGSPYYIHCFIVTMVTVAVLCPLFYRNYGYDSLYYVHYYIVTMVTIARTMSTIIS